MSDNEAGKPTAEGNDNDNNDNDDDEDEVVKAIKAEKNKPRDHPPTITCEDFIVDISFNPARNLIALANIMGDVLLYEYNDNETKLVNTLELHVKACRDVEFDANGTTMYTTAKVCTKTDYKFSPINSKIIVLNSNLPELYIFMLLLL